MIIQPYWKYGTWCFSDEATGLVDEAFVSGANTFITSMLLKKGIDLAKASKGFNLTFSGTFFPDYDVVINHVGDDEHGVGNWYTLELEDGSLMKGWFCPALLKYFSEAPKQIYAKVEELDG